MRIRYLCAVSSIFFLDCGPANASVLADFPLECRIVEPASYSGTKAKREAVLLIERADSQTIFLYSADPSYKRRDDDLFPQFGYFVNLEDGKDMLQANDVATRRDRLQLRREPGGRLRFDLKVGSLREGGNIKGTCRKTRIAASRFPFRDSPWPAKEYAEVRLYQYNASSQYGVPIYSGGRFADSIIKSVKLDDAQIKRLVAATTGAHPDHPVAACYVPRHAFVYLDGKGQPISFAEICFECSNYRLSNSEQARFDLKALAELVQEAGMPLR